ncbi:MAG TPA: hypothetical protein VKS44_12990 [Candidatus Acidoferrales bacterium]|nr:hypothetical protein [Candidatus Acidoferrales bacterium]
MRPLRILCGIPVVLTAAFFLLPLNATAAGANLPSDLCSLLTPQQLQKTFGQPFGAPTKGSFPAPYMGMSEGTKCDYEQKGGHGGVTLIVYVDRSPAEAKQNFDKLSMWFPPKSKPAGIGDSAYIDSNHAIHVLKGKVRYFISINSNPSDKQTIDLAKSVAAQI